MVLLDPAFYFKEKVQEHYHPREILFVFPVLIQGWECDEWAAVIDCGSKTIVVGTNHGALCRLDEEFLRERIGKYREALQLTAQAIEVGF